MFKNGVFKFKMTDFVLDQKIKVQLSYILAEFLLPKDKRPKYSNIVIPVFWRQYQTFFY